MIIQNSPDEYEENIVDVGYSNDWKRNHSYLKNLSNEVIFYVFTKFDFLEEERWESKLKVLIINTMSWPKEFLKKLRKF